MDISNSVTNALSGQAAGDAVGVTVLKKALDMQAQNAMALINALPQPPQAQNLPSHLGQNVNTKA